MLILLISLFLGAEITWGQPLSEFGPSQEPPTTTGTQLSTSDPWESTLEGASSGTYLLRGGTYDPSGNLDIGGITLQPYNGENVTIQGRINITGSNTTIAGLHIDADNAPRCVQAINNSEGTSWNNITIRANQIFGGRDGDCIRIEGNVDDVVLVDNHADGGAGPGGTSGHTLKLRGGCTRSGDDVNTPFTYTCNPDNWVVQHNLWTKNIANHPGWASHGDSEDCIQLEGQGDGSLERNMFWEIADSNHEEYVDAKTPSSGATITVAENYFRGDGMAPPKSCMIVQGDWNPGQLIVRDNLYENCGQNNNRHALHAGGIKAFDDINIDITGNIFWCPNTTGGLQFGDLNSFSAEGNTIDQCGLGGASISPSTNAFGDWQATHPNGAFNPLTLGMANGDFTLFHGGSTSINPPQNLRIIP